MKVELRDFYPGSEWIYFKIYASVSICDELITDVLYPLSSLLIRRKQIVKWFFIRYADPDTHLRYRVYLQDKSYFTDVLYLLNLKLKKYVQDHSVYRVSIDTYMREMERYGADIISETETLFYKNSIQIGEVLNVVKATGENYRWKASILLIDEFLSSLNASLEEKQLLMSELNDSFCKEFGFNTFNSKQLNKLYRNYRPEVMALIQKKYKDDVIQELLKIAKLSISINDNVKNRINKTACIHMMNNRLFPSKNRLHELVIYNFMNRAYVSCMALRNKIP